MPPKTHHQKPTKPPPPPPQSTHLATVELKQTILNSLSKLTDRDTHHIAIQDLQTLIKTTSPDSIPTILNTLFESTSDTTINKPTIKKQAIKLLSFLCASHTQSTHTHLPKIITHIVKRLKDSDFGVKDSCCDSIGHLSCIYLKGFVGEGEKNGGSVVSWFVKPLFEAMSEPNKWVQAGAAMCLGRVVDMASDPPVLGFQKLCGRICKFLNSPNFLANAALLPVVSSLAQVGAISPQYWETLLQSIHDCLNSVDWSTRKAAADTLNALALHSSNLIREKPTDTITVLEACRFDKIKPVRDSITEALQLWKFIVGDHEDQKTFGQSQDSDSSKLSRKDLPKVDDKRVLTPVQNGQTKGQNTSKKTTVTKKKGPPLSDKELNPEFFRRLLRTVSGDVEVVVNGESVNLPSEEVSEVNDNNDAEKSKSNEPDGQVNLQDCRLERGGGGPVFRRPESDNDGNWLGIQRQLLHLERQQARLMNMLQAFKGGSRDGMVTLENRVCGLERMVDDMARNLSVSVNTLRTCYNNGFHESTERPFGKYNGYSHYHTHGPNTQTGSRRAVNNRLPNRSGPIRFVDGPSARSVWKASKDEATLEAIRGGRVTPNVPARVIGNENIGHARDINMAFGEVLSSGDDFSLVKLMDKTGPVIDWLSDDVANEVLCAVAQFLLEPSLFDICLSWIQQLLDMIIENGKDFLGIPVELKMEILANLSEASSSVHPPENWEGLMPDQVLLQLALAWDINLRQLQKQ
ncbi:putative MT-associated protein TORTIFOLIA1/SPIRAL2 [Helianthus anomalus]